jgi:hypothetical protein
VSRLSLGQWIALAGAFIWSLLLLVGASLVPFYQGSVESVGPRGRVRSYDTSGTLVEMEGSGILVVVAVPLAATLLVTLALLAQVLGKNAGPLAWTLVVLLFGFNFLAMLSIGIFLLPTTVALLVACALHNADLKKVPSG